MKRGRPQCKDIDTDAILRFLAQHQGKWSTHGEGYSMPTVRDAMPPGMPRKLQLAKMAQLWNSGLVGGCPCGCRGDWEITDEGLARIGEERTADYTGYGGPMSREDKAAQRAFNATRRKNKHQAKTEVRS